MLVVETVARIRRAYFVQGKAIRAICRELRVSPKVVRKVIRSEATEFHYERGAHPLPRIGPWQGELDQLLAANEAKSRRERLTLIRIFEALRDRGYEGGYDAIRRYARTWQRDSASTTVDAYVPLSFAPGEAFQFDWSHEIVLIGGTTVTVQRQTADLSATQRTSVIGSPIRGQLHAAPSSRGPHISQPSPRPASANAILTG